MHPFEVWAPFARRVSVESGGVVRAMHGPDGRNWWRLSVGEADDGTDYGFLLDDDSKRYPDPRSLWQPKGVHELSRVYDETRFAWTDAGFQAPSFLTGILYELHVGTFTREGTFDAAVSRLDYLVELGITHIELMPVNAFEGRHGWGYDGVAIYAVHEPYGGPDGLKRFVNAAHARGLAVILDVVYNHFGPSGNYSGKFGPYIVDAHQTPWGGAVNLEDGESDVVRRFFCDNALMWLRDYHIDGLRIDAVHAFVDRSAIHFLEQLAIEVEELEASTARRLTLIAESDLNDPRVVTPRQRGGLGIDAQWNDDFHHALFAVLAPEEKKGYYEDFGSVSQLAKAIENAFVYDGIYSEYRKRIHGRPAEQLSHHRFLSYIQNHDQVGNRAKGERISQVAGMDRAKIGAALVLTGPFVPMLFEGEEWAASNPFLYFANHEDPELARAVSKGRKREFAQFGWDPAAIPDPEDSATFEASKLDWEEASQSMHAEMLAWYRALIRLRRNTPCLNDGSREGTRVRYDEKEKWLRMGRGTIVVICNLDEHERAFFVPNGAQLLLASRETDGPEANLLNLSPNTVAIIALQ
ncbi:MAG TPA: malto-oligosyltrehalose trehalohydrolase [Terracidiphilus sp.]|jgi:maltooligosyltrehalose trehalohydrolase|nr:malto-oligosyltrehalose trehalohydrolase [Terracidiphilus sp.]